VQYDDFLKQNVLKIAYSVFCFY